VTQLRILKDAEKFYLYITFEYNNQNLIDTGDTRPVVGIDLGTDNKRSKNFIAVSDGGFNSYRYYESCRLMDKLTKKKKKLQKSLRNKKGGDKNKREKQSNNFKKAYAKIARIDAKIASTRKYHSKMMAHGLAKNYSVIVMENLAIGNMTKSSKGTMEAPGSRVKQKSGLNRAILNVAPYAFKQNVINKAAEFGTKVIEVNPSFTSQRCYKCSRIDQNNRSGTKFKCTNPSCGYETHADTNAAQNIRLLGESGKESVKDLQPKRA
jgi:putative transposase